MSQGFGGTALNTRNAKVDDAIKQVRTRLAIVAGAWRPVLPKQVYLKAMGALVDGVLSRVLDGVLGLSSISEPESHQLLHLLSLLLDCDDVFSVRVPSAAAATDGVGSSVGGAVSLVRAPKAKYIASWEKVGNAPCVVCTPACVRACVLA